jgi:putative ABC transport system ATP-binding protein
MNAQFGTTVVIITHNEAIAGMADQVIRLRDGKIVESQKNSLKRPAAELAL